jgi:hypothetical protein
MAQGLEIYDEGGSPTISVTTSLCRVLGKVDLTDSQGTIVCEDSRLWACVYRISDGDSYPVKITIDGNKINWIYLKDAIYGGGTSAYAKGMRLIYGSY